MKTIREAIALGGGKSNVMRGFNEGICFILIGFATMWLSVLTVLAFIQ